MRPKRTSIFLATLLLTVLLGRSAASPLLDQDSILRDHLWRELRLMPKGRRPVVGLALSGGSLRALAHAGVYTVLEDAGFPIDVVAGVSMGAVLGAAIADGLPARTIRKEGSRLGIRAGSNLGAVSLFRMAFFDTPLSSKKVEDVMARFLRARRFEQLRRPFVCVAMDLYSGEMILFRHGELLRAIRASMNLPGIFSPVEYRHRFLVDGGVVNFIPIDAARLIGADWVLASVTELDYTQSRPKSMLQNLEQVIDIRGSLLAREQRKKADFLIEPQVPDLGIVETGRAPEAIAQGIITASKRLRAAQESLILHTLPRMAPQWVRRPAPAP